jgi:hypothetical protein
MNRWRDIIDWVGGYPYEVSTPDEIFDFFIARGYTLSKLNCGRVGLGCNQFVFIKVPRRVDEGNLDGSFISTTRLKILITVTVVGVFTDDLSFFLHLASVVWIRVKRAETAAYQTQKVLLSREGKSSSSNR